MLEMGESLSIINQTATQLLNLYTVNVNAVSLDAYNYVTSGDLLKNKNNYYSYMEDLIEHFLF
jgi:hypothetical protein